MLTALLDPKEINMNIRSPFINYLFFLGLFSATVSHPYDIIVEGKGSGLIATNDTFQCIYGKGVGSGGVEITAGEYKHLYGFLSTDIFHSSGTSIGLCDKTTATFVEIGIGLKYFVPFRYGDFYLGLGALPTYLRTKDCSPFVVERMSKWNCGGIAKIGTYFNLPKSCIIDLFLNYTFVKISNECCFNECTQEQDAHLNGVILGVGIGYRFS